MLNGDKMGIRHTYLWNCATSDVLVKVLERKCITEFCVIIIIYCYNKEFWAGLKKPSFLLVFCFVNTVIKLNSGNM
jgi:hypothetical protein